MTTWSDEPPAGAHGTGNAADPPPAGLQGDEFRRRWKQARSASNAARRRWQATYVRVADRPAGSRYRTGMARRPPPDDAA